MRIQVALSTKLSKTFLKCRLPLSFSAKDGLYKHYKLAICGVSQSEWCCGLWSPVTFCIREKSIKYTCDVIKLWLQSHPRTSILTVLGFAKTDSNHFTPWLRSSSEACWSNMFIKSNKWLQFDQSDVVIFLATFVRWMWCNGSNIDNLCVGTVIMNVNDSHFNNDGISSLPVIFTMCSYSKKKGKIVSKLVVTDG